MTAAGQSRVLFLVVMPASAFIFCRGITWGLPSRAIDPFLFGHHPVWSGQQILDLAGDRSRDSDRGADVDINPLDDRTRPVWLNETDQQRAEIVRRYRLYTYQPDEMITLMALAEMRPGELKFDPKLYQYGGLWIYPVGALLKIAAMSGYVTLTSDQAFYLDHPEAFGRFYVVARLYVVIWALVGAWAVYWLARRFMAGAPWLPLAAAACFALMPVVVNMSHEAKPHLPAAVLVLLTVIAAIRCVDTGRTGWWLATAFLCGASFGMVLSAWPVFLVLPVLAVLVPETTASRRAAIMMVGVAIGAGVYLVTNPYILINAVAHPAVLQSNFSNSLAMYRIAEPVAALRNAVGLVMEGAGPVLAAIGAVSGLGIVCYLIAGRSLGPAVGWLLIVPAGAIALQFVALAAGKPAEYGRFGLVPAMALCLAAFAGLHHLRAGPGSRTLVALFMILATLVPGYEYLSAFRLDSGEIPSRLRVARTILDETSRDAIIAVGAEPAPYCLPPVDLFDKRIVLLPPVTVNIDPAIEAIACVVDDLKGVQSSVPDGFSWKPTVSARQFYIGPSRMSWADKPTILLLRSHDEPPK